MTRIIFISIFCLSQLNTLYSQPIDTSYTIEGLVFDTYFKNPITGANVLLRNTSLGTTTDTRGHYLITNLRPDSFLVEVRFIGYQGVKLPIVLSPDNRRVYIYCGLTTDFNLEMSNYQSVLPRWNEIDAEKYFTFYLPDGFQKVKGITGIDSYVEEYYSENIQVGFDYGYGIDMDRDTLDFHRVKTIVACKLAWLSLFEAVQTKSEWKYRARLDFSSPRLTLWAKYKRERDKETVLRILHSIKFE
ncbi:MAG: carboxypeptidase-like regulatory domain-containing protein [Ignavibacteriales bacterium]|nr:carboxypeptidase-like regulatory domain-containing protein [Ignavibacteriales bacterium]